MIFYYNGTRSNKRELIKILSKIKERDGAINTLSIVRMQGLHNGHKMLLDFKEEIGDRNILCLGTCQEEGTKNNPYSPSERVEMIRIAKGFDKRFSGKLSIIKMNDLGAVDPKVWKNHVLKTISEYGSKNLPKINVFVAGSEEDILKSGFEDDENILSISLERFESKCMSGTDVRNAIINGLEGWKEHVPFVLHNYLLEHFPKHLLLSERIKESEK